MSGIVCLCLSVSCFRTLKGQVARNPAFFHLKRTVISLHTKYTVFYRQQNYAISNDLSALKSESSLK